MNPYNDKDNTKQHKSQETNIEITQRIAHAACDLDISAVAFRVLFYQVKQEFGFIRNGQVKDGDCVPHSIRCKHLDISRRAEYYAIKELEQRNILIIDRHHKVNRYHINKDTTTWETTWKR